VYAKSAWRFVHAIRPYKPLKKLVKKIGAEVVLLCFSKTQLAGLCAMASQKGIAILYKMERFRELQDTISTIANMGLWQQWHLFFNLLYP
jgi:hypothetical protein